MDVKLIALDLDGTTLTPEKQLSPRTKAAFDACAAKGIHIVPTTGRIFAGLPAALRDLPYLRYAITANGAEVYDAFEHRVLHGAYIPLDLAMRIYDYLDGWDVAYDCYIDGQGYISRHWYDNILDFMPGDEIHAAMLRGVRTPVDDFRGALREMNRPMQKLQCFLKNHGERPALMAELARRFPEIAISYALYFNIELNDRHASKGLAIAKLCEQLDIPLSQAAAFGDGLNDVPMLETAGVSVAMENGCAEAKAAAKYVTASNADDGVAQFIEQYIL